MEDFFDHVLALRGEYWLVVSLRMQLLVIIWVGEYEFPCLNLSVEVLLEFPEKGKLPGEQDKQDDSESPDVCCMPVIILFSRNVWVHIVWGAAEQGQLLVCWSSDAESEIDDFDAVAI